MKKMISLGLLLLLLSVGLASAGVVWDECVDIDLSCYYTVNGCTEEKGCYCGVGCVVEPEEPEEPVSDCSCDGGDTTIYRSGGVSKSWVTAYVEDYYNSVLLPSIDDMYVPRSTYDSLVREYRITQLKVMFIDIGYTNIYTKGGIVFGRNPAGELKRLGEHLYTEEFGYIR